MSNHQIINGMAAIGEVWRACDALMPDAGDPGGLSLAAARLVREACEENPALCNGEYIGNGPQGRLLGTACTTTGICSKVMEVVAQKLPHMLEGRRLQLPVLLDHNIPFNLLLEVDGDAAEASALAQGLVYEMLEQDKRLNLRCADFVSGGSFFSKLHSFITRFPRKTGGRILTDSYSLGDLLKTLEELSAAAMAALKGADSVRSYNETAKVPIERYVCVLYLNEAPRSAADEERLRVLMRNLERNGMSFILAGSRETISRFSGEAGLQLRLGESCAVGSGRTVDFAPAPAKPITEEALEQLIRSMQEAQNINTLYENHPHLHTPLYTLDSTEALRIPFALDSESQPRWFEIGGEAPAHALVAGSTGSGKSVALHTLIMQTIHHYHPDDVEIWAIDYKAVEFAWYIENRAPHFRVIGLDTSPEFSLSLLDLLYQVYEERQKLFLENHVKDINGYRKKFGNRSMSRILVIIDEFQLMTQAVQNYNGSIDYKTRLENLLKLTRAMGISFILCSQTIATGLSGLSDSARDQIGCRMCLKHDDDAEIRETLTLAGPDASQIVSRARELRKGQGIYKRARWSGEHSPDGKSYEYLHSYILYLNNDIRSEMIRQARQLAEGNYRPKEEIIVRGSGRFPVEEKQRHSMNRFLRDEFEADEESLQWYPAAPATLADELCIPLERAAAANVLLVGEDDELRVSVAMHSVLGFLMNPDVQVTACIVDDQHRDRARLLAQLKRIRCPRLKLRTGAQQVAETIAKLRKIRPSPFPRVYLWYGLDKLKNELFLLEQEDEDALPPGEPAVSMEINKELSPEEEIRAFLASLDGLSAKPAAPVTNEPVPGFEECSGILRQAFEMGPENGMFHMVLFNNYKAMKKSGMTVPDFFENRVGSRMSADDSYELFRSSTAVAKTNENTVIYYAGSGQPLPMRPYLLPDDAWMDRYNQTVE